MGLKKYKNDFKLTQHEDEIDLPLHWKKPRMVFVNSMSDLFHEDVDMEFIGRCFLTMIRADHHIYQILTKRPRKMTEFSEMFLKYFGFPIPAHIWMGVSVEDNDAKWRIAELRKTKCSMRFVSFEPLLDEIDRINLRKINWAIIGGESGHHYRKVNEQWIRSLITQCVQQRVRVFFKQWGGPRPKSGGRIIDGRTYDEFPDLKLDKSIHAKMMQVVKQSNVLFPTHNKQHITTYSYHKVSYNSM